MLRSARDDGRRSRRAMIFRASVKAETCPGCGQWRVRDDQGAVVTGLPW